MLTELHIRNFAIIEQLDLNFDQGLVIFTGETGAGKSIILDALEAVLGGRADTTAVRTGDDLAMVEATFRLPPESKPELVELLKSEALQDDENEDFVTLVREIRLEGRNVARINGRKVTAALQREVGSYLVDIHGQSEHLSLLHVRNHLHLLDSYANVGTYLLKYKGGYEQLRRVRKDLESAHHSEKEAARKTDMLTFQIQEIEAAKLSPGEEDILKQERNRLANAESLAKFSQTALMLIEEGPQDVPGISDLLGEVVESLQSLARVDPTAQSFFERAESGLAGLQDLALELQSYGESIEFNPNSLNHIEERLDLISNLKRKYGNTIDEIIAFGEIARAELDAITHLEEHLEELEAREAELLVVCAEAAQDLSRQRIASAETLSRQVEIELDDLQMAESRFTVLIGVRPDPTGLPLENGERVAFDADGYDQVEFFVETNPGEGFKPLVKVASGGETSRLMLALKNVLAQADHVPTLVFDEIDQGIGGRVGFVVGEKLWNLSRQHQVMCITHLPQLAGFGDQHLRVAKELVDGRTYTRVVAMEDEEQRQELAQMFGPVSEGTLKSADEIMKMVSDHKSSDKPDY